MHLSKKLQNSIDLIFSQSAEVEFDMSCDPAVAELCALLASPMANKNLLEFGTGSGLSTLYIAQLMPESAELTTVDVEQKYVSIAKDAIGSSKNIRFLTCDAGEFLKLCQPNQFSYIFADAWPGKYSHLNYALRALDAGGLYIIDDLLPQDNWPKNHQPRVDALLEAFELSSGFVIRNLNWGTGVAIVVKTGETSEIEREIADHPKFSFLFSDEETP